MARPAVYVNCKICKTLFKRKRVNQFFCSFLCGGKGKRYVQTKFAKKVSVLCDYCSVEFEKWPCFFYKIVNGKHYCSGKCRKMSMKEGKTPYGFKKTTGSPLNPYRRVVKDGKFVYEHRWIMEQFIGRKLKYSEHVHHINGNPKDNRIENLEILTRSEHAKKHFGKY